MRILVLNGSPKGCYSTTLYTVKYIEKLNPSHEFIYLNVAKDIKKYENDFTLAQDELLKADLILFSYPVYTFIVPSQLHRFIELMKESEIDLSGKFVTQITTSKHFYDITAHNFIEENSYDLGLKVIKGLSQDMDDLPTEKGQKDAINFFKFVEYSVTNNIYEPSNIIKSEPKHIVVNSIEEVAKDNSKIISLVTDLDDKDKQLKSMIDRFINEIPYKVNLINIHDFPFKNGCISCFNCTGSGVCIFKDDFQELLRDKIQKGNAIVIAFSIKDHSMGSIFKTYDDRQFCNGHRTVTMGMPFGYIISGDYSKENNLKMIIEGRAEVGGNYLSHVATDEFNPDRDIDLLCQKLTYSIDNKYEKPSNFLGVGGMKIFRDLIWLMQGMMKADHKFYKEHNQYDFPQKKRGTMLSMYLVGGMMNNKKLKLKLGDKINEGMVAPYKKVLDSLDEKNK